jgi:PAS domain S-box-containing protein
MFEFFRRLLATDFMAHVYCLREPSLIALHAISDGLIATAYFVIPIILVMLVRRRKDLPFRWAYILFGLFILACGTTHILGVVTLWHPVYRLEGAVKALTAFASIGTALMLARVMPAAVSLPGPHQFRQEIEQRRRAEEQIRSLNTKLESKVSERTRELEESNQRLSERTRELEESNKNFERSAEALRTSESRNRSLFENASQGVLTADHEGRIQDANAMVERLFGYDRSELIGAPVEMLLPQSIRDRHVEHRAGYVAAPHVRFMGQGMDLTALRKDGSEFPVEVSLSYVPDHRSGQSIAFVSDITVRKQATQEREVLISKLQGALAEKTVLLKEVLHRVKNNLAVVAGLLGMQAESLENEAAAAALGESQQRVLSMAMIHEYLYATEHLDRVDFGEYVDQLANKLFADYATQSHHVNIRTVADKIDLPVPLAIPCGLILNELISNALKYAFPDGRSGEITVQLTRRKSGSLSLSCEDDGIGIPENFDWQNAPSLGLRIIIILTKQIHGELTLDRSHGTKFELSFSPS